MLFVRRREGAAAGRLQGSPPHALLIDSACHSHPLPSPCNHSKQRQATLTDAAGQQQHKERSYSREAVSLCPRQAASIGTRRGRAHDRGGSEP